VKGKDENSSSYFVFNGAAQGLHDRRREGTPRKKRAHQSGKEGGKGQFGEGGKTNNHQLGAKAGPCISGESIVEGRKDTVGEKLERRTSRRQSGPALGKKKATTTAKKWGLGRAKP